MCKFKNVILQAEKLSPVGGGELGGVKWLL